MIVRKTIIIAVVCFLLGAGTVYFYNLNWAKSVETKTNRLILTFRDTYDIQQKLSSNYSQSYDALVQCLAIEKENCNQEETVKKFQQIKIERDDLKNQLEKANTTTQLILNGN